jgi:hypothetical protein
VPNLTRRWLARTVERAPGRSGRDGCIGLQEILRALTGREAGLSGSEVSQRNAWAERLFCTCATSARSLGSAPA